MLKRGLLIGATVFAVAGSTASAAGANTLYVSQHSGSNANPCTIAHPCQKLAFTVAKAKAGDTIIVEKGTYSQYVLVTKRLRILGQPGAVDNLKGRNNGFNIQGPKAAGTEIAGFTIENATFEGIVAQNTSGLLITHNTVKHNDLGIHASKPTGECAPFGGGPGDCGEGIHLYWGVTGSTISNNVIKGNTGGILLTDQSADGKDNKPTAHNTIKNNTILNNVLDCGVTLAGHSSLAAPGGKPGSKPAAGVFANAITGNVSNGNGVKGEGAGILMAGGAPGTAVYNNLVKGNTANGNGLAGVTIHSHAPGQDLNGNKILNNRLSHNGVADTDEAEFGGADFAKNTTVDILVGSSVAKLTGIVITGNTLSNAHFGVYAKNVANKVNPKKNSFHKVAVKVKQV